uniref:NADH-cytochrome b5 reductase n=1 Tax=Photinus pyralis TaxID=7054 RepID=A0A1Y1KDV7_PHOPY
MEPPLKPNEADCCNSGCNPCIFDVYEDQLNKYLNKQLYISDARNCLSQTAYTAFTLKEIKPHAKNTFIYTFRYGNTPDNCNRVLYKPGQHLLMKADDNAVQFTRAYTPIPGDGTDLLSFTVLVKLYENGAMSAFFRNLRMNDDVLWRGPYGDYEVDYGLSRLLLIAQGTGIAPLYTIAHDILHNESCETFVHLFLCSRTEDDIPLRDELYQLASYWNFTYEIFLSQATRARCKYNETVHDFRLSSNEIEAYFLRISDDRLQVLICGSDAFNVDVSRLVTECKTDGIEIVAL